VVHALFQLHTVTLLPALVAVFTVARPCRGAGARGAVTAFTVAGGRVDVLLLSATRGKGTNRAPQTTTGPFDPTQLRLRRGLAGISVREGPR
jgi:hypothetical protein